MTKNSSYKAICCIFIIGVMILLNLFFVSAIITTSGTITYQDIGGVNYTTITFLSGGTFNITEETLNASILVVGGGGGGGSSTSGGAGGGGGAGGIIYNNSALLNGNFTINIGSGGTGVASSAGTAGKISYFGNLNFNMTAFGGGYGSKDTVGGNGGSGGGVGGSTNIGGSSTQNSANGTGYGNAGGNGRGGGGGGAGTMGGNTTNGVGGVGKTFTIYNGTTIYYAGGGGAGGSDGNFAGGLGGGGTGTASGTGGAGTANTGGGGGGSANNGIGGAGGTGIVIVRYLTSGAILVNLISPLNNTVISSSLANFSINLTMSGTNYSYQWDNATTYVWFSNGTVFNSTIEEGLSTNDTSSEVNISGFLLGNYLWNVYACYSNDTFGNCSWASNNFSLTKGSSINSFTYNNHTYETSLEQFYANISIAEGAEVSLAQLYYNGTNYTISNITSFRGYYLIEKTISIPLNINASANQTNEFYLRFTYSGSSVQLLGPYYQNSSFIKLIQCSATYTTKALNFSFWDEYSQLILNSATNKTTLYTTFKYWLGDGSVYKNYSFQNITSTLNNYQFCIYPYASNLTFKTDMDMEYTALTYRENKYYLRNSTLTNGDINISLYLLSEDIATKFFLTFKHGIRAIDSGIINVQKYFTGLGTYVTVAILNADEDGKATMWQEVDKTYRYSIVQNGELLGVIDRVSICSASPCSLTIMIDENIGDSFEAYYDYYAQNVLSNITYNKNTKVVTYDFIDVTGLAHYFRFEVKQTNLNSAGTIICNTTSYSSAGSIICNLTGYDGDFIASGYISRSPEKLDKIISFIIDEDVLENLGINGLFITMIIIIVIVIAGAVVSKGNPSTILFFLGIGILALKLIKLFPFGWIVTVSLEFLIFWMIFKTKS